MGERIENCPCCGDPVVQNVCHCILGTTFPDEYLMELSTVSITELDDPRQSSFRYCLDGRYVTDVPEAAAFCDAFSGQAILMEKVDPPSPLHPFCENVFSGPFPVLAVWVGFLPAPNLPVEINERCFTGNITIETDLNGFWFQLVLYDGDLERTAGGTLTGNTRCFIALDIISTDNTYFPPSFFFEHPALCGLSIPSILNVEEFPPAVPFPRPDEPSCARNWFLGCLQQSQHDGFVVDGYLDPNDTSLDCPNLEMDTVDSPRYPSLYFNFTIEYCNIGADITLTPVAAV